MSPEHESFPCPSCGYPAMAGHASGCPNGMKKEAKVESEPSKTTMALSLIETIGGKVDADTKPYKDFNPAKHERFFIQKGEMNGETVVFKVGKRVNEAGELRDEATLKNESRNLRVVERASASIGDALDVRFVRQVGHVYENENMVGLATEYVQDDLELKRGLTPEQKVATIGRVIENLQRLPVTDEVHTEGLPTHDGEKMVRDASHFLVELEREQRISPEAVGLLRKQFQDAAVSLAAEQPVFVHGDAHGDNIFVSKTTDGIDVTLLDFEGLRISNRYHDWAEILNKSAFLKHVERDRPDLFESIRQNVERMWLDSSVEFDEEAIVNRLTEGDPDKAKNFRLTRAYDMLTRIMSERNNTAPLAQERVNLFLKMLSDSVAI